MKKIIWNGGLKNWIQFLKKGS